MPHCWQTESDQKKVNEWEHSVYRQNVVWEMVAKVHNDDLQEGSLYLNVPISSSDFATNGPTLNKTVDEAVEGELEDVEIGAAEYVSDCPLSH